MVLLAPNSGWWLTYPNMNIGLSMVNSGYFFFIMVNLWLIYGLSMINLSGWWYTYPSEKYESQLGSLFPIYGNKKKMKPPTSDIP